MDKVKNGRKKCPQCKGTGGKLVFGRTNEGFGFSNSPVTKMVDCSKCGGQGYLEDYDIPKDEQGLKYWMYP